MAWIRTVPPEQAEGRLRRIYDAAIKRAGRVFNIVRLQSIDPPVLQASGVLYQAVMLNDPGPLPRWFRELIGVSVSRANDCHY